MQAMIGDLVVIEGEGDHTVGAVIANLVDVDYRRHYLMAML